MIVMHPSYQQQQYSMVLRSFILIMSEQSQLSSHPSHRHRPIHYRPIVTKPHPPQPTIRMDLDESDRAKSTQSRFCSGNSEAVEQRGNVESDSGPGSEEMVG